MTAALGLPAMRRTITVLMLAAAASLAAPSPAHAGMLWADVCTAPDTKALPFCDTTKSIEARVADYVGRVPLANKTRMMVNNGAAYTPLQIPPYQFGSEGLHGPLQPCVCTADNKSCACPTSFPCPSAMATAFNDSLYLAVGHADGVEARAINNLRNHETQNNYGEHRARHRVSDTAHCTIAGSRVRHSAGRRRIGCSHCFSARACVDYPVSPLLPRPAAYCWPCRRRLGLLEPNR